MNPSRSGIARLARVLALTLGTLLISQAPSSAQFLGPGYGGYGGPGFGGYGGPGYGGIGYGGFGGYGGLGYGGIGYGGIGYGGGFGYGGVGYGGGFGYVGTDLTGLGPTGIGWRNPLFGVGLSPLAVESAIFERRVLGRTAPVVRSASGPEIVVRPVASGPVGMGTFSAPR